MKNNNGLLDYIDDCFEKSMNQIAELSRNLQTYLNYREASIRAICSENQPSRNISQIITTWEKEMILQYHEYETFLENNTTSEDDLKLKYLIFAQKVKSFPNSPEARSFRNFLRNKIKLWKSLHILSGLEIHSRPQLLKRTIQILTRVCDDESKLNANIPDFFQQLKLNYQQLDQEYEQLLFPREKKEQNKSKNKKKKVMVRE